MKKMLVIAAMLTIAALVTAPAFALTFTDNFESGLGAWTNAAGCTSLTQSNLQNVTPGGSSSAFVGAHSFDKMYHNLGEDLATTWTISFSLLDDSNYNTYGEVRGYTGGGYGSGTLAQDIIAGAMSFTPGVAMSGEVYDSTKYQGRFILATGANGWFNLDAVRTPGWHTFSIARTADGMVTWYVDGVKDRSFSNVTNSGMNVVAIGAAGSGANNSFFDDVLVTNVVPEPGSLLVMGTGLAGVIGLLRRRSA